MKKTNLFRSMAAAAMAVLTAGMFAFSSCDQLALDETGLQDSIDDLTDRVESLEEKVATLEEQAATVSGLLENGKIISGIAENAPGSGRGAGVNRGDFFLRGFGIRSRKSADKNRKSPLAKLEKM